QPTHSGTHRSQGKNGTFMGVDPTSGAEHCLLCCHTQGAQLLKGSFWWKLGSLLPQFHCLLKIGQQGSSAVQKREHIHIPVAAVVVSVYKPRLWSGAHLIHQGFSCQISNLLGIPMGKELGQNLFCYLLQFLHRMEPAGGTAFPNLPTYQTGT